MDDNRPAEITGRIWIYPPLNAQEINTWSRAIADSDLVVEPYVSTLPSLGRPGSPGRREGLSMVAAAMPDLSPGRVVCDVQAVVDMFTPDHRFTGYLESQGQCGHPLWRCTVTGGRAVRVDATWTWTQSPAGAGQ